MPVALKYHTAGRANDHFGDFALGFREADLAGLLFAGALLAFALPPDDLAASLGAFAFFFAVVTLLEQHFPDRKDKVLGRVRELHGGALSGPAFGARMRGTGLIADTVKQMFTIAKKKLGFPGKPALSTAAFRRPDETPLSLFGDE